MALWDVRRGPSALRVRKRCNSYSVGDLQGDERFLLSNVCLC